MKITTKSFFHAILFVASTLFFASANAETIVEKVNVGGSFLTSRINVNMDSEASSWCTLHIKGGLQGSSMQQCINEDVPSAPTAECPGGVFVVDASTGTGGGRGVRTFANGVDQLFIELRERHLCVGLTPEFQPFFKESYDRGVILGGTGRFASATGTYMFTYSGTLLYGDPFASPPQFFGSIIGTGTYEINIPD